MHIDSMLDTIALPEGLRWLQVRDQKLFPVYGPSGSLTTRIHAILIKYLHPRFDWDFGGPGYHAEVFHTVPWGEWYVLEWVYPTHDSVSLEKFQEDVNVAIQTLEKPK